MTGVSWQVVGAATSYKRKLSPEATSSAKNMRSEINSNRFTILSQNDESDTANTVNDKNRETIKNNKNNESAKPPPIVIPYVDDISKMIGSLTAVAVKSDNFSYKSMRDGQIRIMSNTIEAYRRIVQLLNDFEVMYHSYQPKQNKAFRVVLKNLNFSISTTDMKIELLKLGHKVRSITNLKSRTDRRPLPIFFVDIEPADNNKEVYNVKYLCNSAVRVDQPRKINDLVQCHRCQEFGHTKNYCRKLFVCVKCGLGHSTTDCKKPAAEPPKCIHCLGNHTANYKGCQVYRDLINRKNVIIRNKRENNYIPLTSHTIHKQSSTNNNSYASVLKSTNEQNNESTTFEKIEKLISKQIEMTNSLLNMMSTLLNKLCN